MQIIFFNGRHLVIYLLLIAYSDPSKPIQRDKVQCICVKIATHRAEPARQGFQCRCLSRPDMGTGFGVSSLYLRASGVSGGLRKTEARTDQGSSSTDDRMQCRARSGQSSAGVNWVTFITPCQITCFVEPTYRRDDWTNGTASSGKPRTLT